MKTLLIKITLISAVLVCLLASVSWAQHGSRHRRVRQSEHFDRGESHRPSRIHYQASRPNHRSLLHHRRDYHHGVRHHRPRHHGRRHIVHHRRPIHQHNYYYSGSPWCSGFHFGGYVTDPGYYFSFGASERW